MPLSSYVQGTFSFLHANQIDAIYTVYSSSQIKTFFDSQATELKANHNGVITVLGQTSAGDSGAENIGSAPISGVTGTKVYAQLSDLKSQIDGAVVGQVPLTTITPYGGTTTNSGNNYSLAQPVIGTLAEGYAVKFKCNADSTGAVTLNWNSTGAKSILKSSGSAATALKANSIYTVVYNGTAFMLQGEGGDSLIPKLPNILKNGSVENGFNCFIKEGDVNSLVIDTTTTHGGSKSVHMVTNNSFAFQDIPNIANGSKIYMCGWAYIKNASYLTHAFELSDYNSYANIVIGHADTSKLNQWQFVSCLKTLTSLGVRANIGIWSSGQTDDKYIDDCMVIDLTAAYGAGNEPTKEEMDAAVQNNGGWWDSDLQLLTSDATATAAADIVTSKTAYVNGQILTGTNNNKKWASGYVTSSMSTVGFTLTYDSSIEQWCYITVTGLTFKPSFIIARCSKSITTYDEVGADIDDYTKVVKVGEPKDRSGMTGIIFHNIKGDVYPASVTALSFTLPAYWAGNSYYWIAFE